MYIDTQILQKSLSYIDTLLVAQLIISFDHNDFIINIRSVRVLLYTLELCNFFDICLKS